MGNKIYTKDELAQQRKKRRGNLKSLGFAKGLLKVVNGEFLLSDFVLSQFNFFLFLSGLAMAYIAHGYYVNRLGNDIKKATQELNELNAMEVTLKSDYHQVSLQSEVSKQVDNMGLIDPTEPPVKIVLEN